MAYNAGTNVFSGGPIVDQAGQILLALSGTVDGATCTVARAKINVGPTDLNPGTVNITIGQPLTNDLYRDIDCGDLGPPKFTNLSGFPTGLSLSTVGTNANMITGTPTGTGTLTGTATNALGQSISFSRIYAVPTPGSGTPFPLFPSYANLTAQGLIGSLDPDLSSSLTFSTGGFGTGGQVSAIAGADGTTAAAVQATSGFQPTSVIVNSRGALRFTRGLTQFLNWDALAAAFPNAFGTTANSSFTLVAVVQLASLTAPFQVVIDVGHAAVAATVQRAYLSANTAQWSFTSGGGTLGIATDGANPTQNIDTGIHCLVARCFPSYGSNSACININPIDTITIGAVHASSAFSNYADMYLLRLAVLASTSVQLGISDVEKSRIAAWSSAKFGTV
jgi:hypothetical protein